jgi:hypothetical protein
MQPQRQLAISQNIEQSLLQFQPRGALMGNTFVEYLM